MRSGRSMAVRTFTVDEVRDVYDLRAHLESYAARRAAERIADHEIAELRAVQDAIATAVAAEHGDETERRREPARRTSTSTCSSCAPRAPRRWSERGQRRADAPDRQGLPLDGPDEKRRSAVEHCLGLELLAARDAPGAEAAWRRHIELGRDVPSRDCCQAGTYRLRLPTTRGSM